MSIEIDPTLNHRCSSCGCCIFTPYANKVYKCPNCHHELFLENVEDEELREATKDEIERAQSARSSYSQSTIRKGCYIATAVYGSYDCPQVWTLRRYRDYTLSETWYGRAFIRTYYAISPTLVKWFGKTEWFRSLWKPTLDRIVEKLNGEGVKCTPYSDRNW